MLPISAFGTTVYAQRTPVKPARFEKLRISIATALVLTAFSPLAYGAGAASKKETKSVSISESKDGDGLVVAMSEALARSLLEGMVGADLKCGSDIDGDFAAMLHKLDRGGRGSRATIRDEDGVVTARRSGNSLKIELDDGCAAEVGAGIWRRGRGESWRRVVRVAAAQGAHPRTAYDPE